MKIILKIVFKIILLSCLTSCALRDPAVKKMAPNCPAASWNGPKVALCSYDMPLDAPLPDRTLTVEELVDYALRNNPLTRQTWAIARSAAFNWEASKSLLYPSINIEESLNFNYSKLVHRAASTSQAAISDSLGPDDTSTTIVSTSSAANISAYQQEVIHNLTLSYLLLDFGGRDAAISSTKHALFAADWMHNRSLQNVTFNVLRNYYLYMGAKALYEAYLINLKDAQQTFDAANAQFQAGIVTIVDVLQAKSILASARLSVEQTEGLVKTTSGQLASALGVPANTSLKVENLSEKLPLDAVTNSIEKLIVLAKEQRPDLAAAYATFLQKEADWGVAKSNGKPFLTTSSSLERNVFIHTPSLNNNFYQASLTLSIPIFQGFLYTNLEKKAYEDMQTAYDQMLVTESNVMLEVVTSYYNYKTAVETVKFSREFLEYSQESYDAIFFGYKRGVYSVLDVLIAQNTLANARAQEVQARTQLVTALANLSYSTGSL